MDLDPGRETGRVWMPAHRPYVRAGPDQFSDQRAAHIAGGSSDHDFHSMTPLGALGPPDLSADINKDGAAAVKVTAIGILSTPTSNRA
ncbi:MAG: hypothetical protein NVS4B6_10910 [Mycobacterium sp.]